MINKYLESIWDDSSKELCVCIYISYIYMYTHIHIPRKYM